MASYNQLLQRVVNQVWQWTRKVPWILGRRAFLVIMVMIIIEILLGQLLFYEYVFLARANGQENPSLVTFNQSLYTSVLNGVQERQDALRNFSQQAYRNPFR